MNQTEFEHTLAAQPTLAAQLLQQLEDGAKTLQLFGDTPIEHFSAHQTMDRCYINGRVGPLGFGGFEIPTAAFRELLENHKPKVTGPIRWFVPSLRVQNAELTVVCINTGLIGTVHGPTLKDLNELEQQPAPCPWPDTSRVTRKNFKPRDLDEAKSKIRAAAVKTR